MLKILLMILIGIIIAGCNGDIKKYVPPEQLLNEPEFTTKLAGRLLVDLNRLEIPGLQVAIIKDDQLTKLAIGTEDYQRKSPLTSDHLLRLGSVSKLYTATMIMKLVEEEQLELENTIEPWFPELPQAEQITIRNLLNHTSGIYNYTENRYFQIKTVLNPQKAWQPAELYSYVLRGKPYFQPGAKHYYSNSNYLLLGLIAEKISGQEYGQLLSRRILQPSSLPNTSLQPTEEVPPQLITGYDRDIVPLGLHKHLPTHSGWASAGYTAGGIASTASETAQFIHRLFSYQILKKETLEKMLQFYLCQDPDLPEQTGYGLGIRRLVLENDTLWGHTGTIPGFGGAAFYCHESNYYIVILGNISKLNQTQILSTIIQTIHEQDLYGEEKPYNLQHAG